MKKKNKKIFGLRWALEYEIALLDAIKKSAAKSQSSWLKKIIIDEINFSSNVAKQRGETVMDANHTTVCSE